MKLAGRARLPPHLYCKRASNYSAGLEETRKRHSPSAAYLLFCVFSTANKQSGDDAGTRINQLQKAGVEATEMHVDVIR